MEASFLAFLPLEEDLILEFLFYRDSFMERQEVFALIASTLFAPEEVLAMVEDKDQIGYH